MAVTTFGNLAVIEYLVNLGININHQDNDGNTALHWAVIRNEVECIRLLLNLKASANIKNSFGDIPFEMAKKLNNQAAINVFQSLN
jgi:ankyrin repeat protein